MKSRVIKNIFSSWGMYTTITAIRFFLTPFFIYKLGDSQYGIWILILSLIGYMELMNFGLNTANVKYLSKYFEEKDDESANKIFNSGLFLFINLGFGIFLLTLIIAPFLGKAFSFMNDSILYPVIFVIAGFNLALELVFYAFSAILSAKQKFVEVNIITTSLFILRNMVAVTLLLSGYQLLAIVINQSVFNIVRGVIISIYSLKSTQGLTINIRSVKKTTILLIAHFSAYIFIINICRKINLSIASVIIAIFMTPNAITFFAIANNLIKYLQHFVLAIPKVLLPRFSQLEAAGEQAKIREHYLSFTRMTLIVSIPVVFVLMFYGSSFITLWIGKDYAKISGSILTILAVGTLCQLSQSTTHSVMKGTGRHKELSFFTVLETTSIVILSLIFIQKHGLIGLAYAHAIPLCIMNIAILPIFACKVLGIRIWVYYTQYLFKNIFSLIPLLVVLYFIKTDIMDSLPVFMLISTIIMGIFLASSYLFTLNLKEKQMLNNLVKAR